MTDDRGLVAITGANGTIGYACVVYALQAGYCVRCVVRSENAFTKIKSGLSLQPYLDRIECAIVPDNAIEGAYDEALASAHYVVHIAGAWPLPHLHPDNQIYYPFIKSTENIIKAAERAETVKRIVFTQAGAGLIDSEVGDTYGNQMKQVLNEHVEVNQAALAYRPPLKSPHQAYCASKSQCMTLINNLRLSNETKFSIAQVIPGTVIGTSESVTSSAQAAAHMDRQTKAILFDEMKPRYAFGFVNVLDCARVHIEALDETKVKKEDLPPWFVAAGTIENGVDGKTLWNQVADMVERDFRNEMENGTFIVGRSKAPINMPYRVDSRLTEKLLLGGDHFKDFQECVQEVAQWYVDLKKKEG